MDMNTQALQMYERNQEMADKIPRPEFDESDPDYQKELAAKALYYSAFVDSEYYTEASKKALLTMNHLVRRHFKDLDSDCTDQTIKDGVEALDEFCYWDELIRQLKQIKEIQIEAYESI
jgi:hypothetical protein